jgi:UDP-N-acetyl-D-glucosamine/UDP-N-acetyl-D-galactosamine dehydrogenase
MGERIAVIGLGYVGLPVAVGMARAHGRVVGFDIDRERVAALSLGHDATREFRAEARPAWTSAAPTTPASWPAAPASW